jgi:hypothetical protein
MEDKELIVLFLFTLLGRYRCHTAFGFDSPALLNSRTIQIMRGVCGLQNVASVWTKNSLIDTFVEQCFMLEAKEKVHIVREQ